ncbi:hypothetical protein B0T22DRAFT_255686 [Podospora appendiculata]|uniref:Uncharacterized protein n=1 Tax=Podospora appendiculata TaxID=314037 RepID=A0AAE0X2S1_9PEZI|nr:hypothetical protein B0T22DRAFT_255686 [Podospora appendiculata]
MFFFAPPPFSFTYSRGGIISCCLYLSCLVVIFAAHRKYPLHTIFTGSEERDLGKRGCFSFVTQILFFWEGKGGVPCRLNTYLPCVGFLLRLPVRHTGDRGGDHHFSISFPSLISLSMLVCFRNSFADLLFFFPNYQEEEASRRNKPLSRMFVLFWL